MYGSSSVAVRAANVDVPITIKEVTHQDGTKMLVGRSFGRYFREDGTTPTELVDVFFQPSSTEPSILVDQTSLISGWFEFPMISQAGLIFQTQSSKEILFSGPVTSESEKFLPSSKHLKMYLPWRSIPVEDSSNLVIPPTFLSWGFWGPESKTAAMNILKPSAGFGIGSQSITQSSVGVVSTGSDLSLSYDQSFQISEIHRIPSSGAWAFGGTPNQGEFSAAVNSAELFQTKLFVGLSALDGLEALYPGGFIGAFRLFEKTGTQFQLIQQDTNQSPVIGIQLKVLPGVSEIISRFEIYIRSADPEFTEEESGLDCRRVVESRDRWKSGRASNASSNHGLVNTTSQLVVFSTNLEAANLNGSTSIAICGFSPTGELIRTGTFFSNQLVFFELGQNRLPVDDPSSEPDTEPEDPPDPVVPPMGFETSLSPNLPSIHNNSAPSLLITNGEWTHYKFKFGPQASTECSDDAGYSAPKLKDQPLLSDPSTDGDWRLCILGSYDGITFTAAPAAYVQDWILDTLPPAVPTFSASPPVVPVSNELISLKFYFRVSCETGSTVFVAAGEHYYRDSACTAGEAELDATPFPADAAFGSEGPITLTVKAKDLAGNESPALTRSFRRNAVVQLASGSDFSCALFESRAVKCWGSNSDGRLGIGATGTVGTIGKVSTVSSFDYPMSRAESISFPSGFVVNSIAAGGHSACAIATDGRLLCWGKNDDGQLGRDSGLALGDDPGEITAASPIDLGSGRTAKKVSLGTSHTCAILDNDQLKCWGKNNNGQLGLGDNNARGDGAGEMAVLPSVDIGAFTAKAVWAGFSHTCVIRGNDSLVCFGANSSGQLGDGSNVTKGDETSEMGANLAVVLTDVSTVAIAGASTCASKIGTNSSDRNVWCWGENTYGQVAQNNTTNYNTPQLVKTHATAPGTLSAHRVYGAGTSFFAWMSSGSGYLSAWGSSSYGQLGLGQTTDQQFAKIVNLEDLSEQSIAPGTNHVCTLRKQYGSIHCWGLGTSGSLGHNLATGFGGTSGETPASLSLPRVLIEIPVP